MILNVHLNSKVTDYDFSRCNIAVVVELSGNDFRYFQDRPLDCYDFITGNLDKLQPDNSNIHQCIMVLNEENDDGILVDPQGYDYARYSAYVPNAKQIVQAQYPSLNEFNDRMRGAVDKYVSLALENHKEGKYTFDINDVNREYDCENFNSDLFVDMIGECDEFSDVEYCGGEFTVTLNKDFLSEKDKTLFPKDVKEMCARHTLWILDLEGGEQADFSGCIVENCDFIGVDLSGAKFENARFYNCNFECACLMGAKMNNALFSNCSFRLSTSEEVEAKKAVFDNCDFEQSDFITSNFKEAVFNDCAFSCISIENSCIEGTKFNKSIPDAEEVERCHSTEYEFLKEEKYNGPKQTQLS